MLGRAALEMFRTGMIEAWGRGIDKIMKGCQMIGVPNPIIEDRGSNMSIEFIAPEDALYLPTGKATGKVTGKATDQVESLLSALGEEELDTKSIMARLNLSSSPNFRELYLYPALELGLVERTLPDKPTSPKQKYRCVRCRVS
jgi:ATP-dependent DNA helicase RecG